MKLSDKKIVITLFILTFSSKIISFFREIVVASAYGASTISDVYIIALSIPMILFSGVNTAVLTAYIPINSEIKLHDDKDQESRFTINLIKIFTIGMSIITIVGLVFTEPIVELFFSSTENDMLNLAVSLTRINFPIIIFLVISSILIGYLQCNGELIAPNSSLLIYNLIFFIGVIGNNVWGIRGITYVNVIAVILQVIYLYHVCNRRGLKLNLKIPQIDSNIKKVIFMSFPIFIGAFSQQLNSLIDKFLGAKMGSGIVSAFSYSNKLVLLIYGFVLVWINNFVYPKLANLKTREEQNYNLVMYLKYTTIILLPIILFFTLFSEEIVSSVFMRGAFNHDAVKTTSIILKYYSIAIIFWALRDLLSNILYLYNDSKTPMINTIIGSVLNIILSILFSITYGYKGIAIGTVISSVVTSILILYSLVSKYNFRFKKKDCYIMFMSIISLMITFGGCTIIKLIKGNYIFLNNSIINLGLLFIVIVSIYSIVLTCISYKYLIKVFRRKCSNDECV